MERKKKGGGGEFVMLGVGQKKGSECWRWGARGQM